MINKLSKLGMLGWTILCFIGVCAGMMNVSQQTHGHELGGAEAVGVGFGLFFWIVLWAVPMVVLGIIALVTRPTTVFVAPAPNLHSSIRSCSGCGRPASMSGRFCTGCGMPFAPALSSTNLLSTRTTAPPPRRWAKFIGVSATVIGVIFVLSALAHLDSQSPSSNSATTAKENAEPTTAKALFRAYHANEVAADEFYKGRLLAVSGRVEGIRKDFSDGIYVELQTENEFESVRAELSDGQAENASALFKGASVTVVCRGTGMILGSPGLKDC